MSDLTFGSIRMSDYGVVVSGLKTHGSPKRSGTFVSVAGKNGDMFIPNGRFENISIDYDAYISSSWISRWNDFKNALYAHADSYQRLTDTYNPNYFRKAMLTGAIDPEVGTGNKFGTFTINFNCKPERWLISGETAIEYTSSGNITNPTQYGAHPLIRVYGAGTIQIGENNIIVSTAGTEYIDIDTDLCEAYEGTTNRNGCISAQSTFGTIPAGQNAVTFTGFTRVKITPRWWTV